MSLQAFMADMVRATLAADRNRTKLKEIEAHLKTLPPTTYTNQDLLDALDAPRRSVTE